MVSVSKYLKDTEDTAPHVSVPVSYINFKSIFPNPAPVICEAIENYIPGRDRSGRVARGRDGDGGGRVLHLRVVRGMMRGRRGRVAMASMRMRVRGPHGLPEEWRFVPRVVKVVVQLALVVPERGEGNIVTISYPWRRDTGKYAAQGPNIMSPEGFIV